MPGQKLGKSACAIGAMMASSDTLLREGRWRPWRGTEHTVDATLATATYLAPPDRTVATSRHFEPAVVTVGSIQGWSRAEHHQR